MNTQNDLHIKVLVAEDTPMFQKVIRRCLEQMKCEAVIAENGRLALDLLEKDPATYQLLVSDIEMPELDGMSLVSRLREHPVLCGLPAIACSSRTEPEFREQALARGFDEYLVKLNEDELKRTVALWLVRGVRRQPAFDQKGQR